MSEAPRIIRQTYITVLVRTAYAEPADLANKKVHQVLGLVDLAFRNSIELQSANALATPDVLYFIKLPIAEIPDLKDLTPEGYPKLEAKLYADDLPYTQPQLDKKASAEKLKAWLISRYGDNDVAVWRIFKDIEII